MTFVEPTAAYPSRAALLLGYLDYFRAQVASRLSSLAEDDLRRSLLPSGWTPLELAAHLCAVERRWLEWGFAGARIDDPWRDERDGRWHVAAYTTRADLLAELSAQAERSRAIVDVHGLDDVGAPGPRWEGADPPTLERVLLHLVQEYARHAGHLDVAAELVGGATGE